MAFRSVLRPAGQVDPLASIAATTAQAMQPWLQNEVLPALQRDTALQREVGGAAGHALAADFAPIAWTAAAALVVIALASVYRAAQRS